MKAATQNKRIAIYKKFGSGSLALRTILGGQREGSFAFFFDQLETIRSPEEYWQYYFKNVLPKSVEIFQAVAEYQLRGDKEIDERFNNGMPILPRLKNNFRDAYDVLITLVGFSPEPLLHAIFTLQPREKIYLICTDATEKFESVSFVRFLKQLVKYNLLQITEAEPESMKVEGLNYRNSDIDVISETVDSVFSQSAIKAIKEIAELEKNKGKRVALDITGGKKIILAGAYAIAAFYDLDTYYVDFEEFDPEKSGKPVPGTEFLNQLLNPVALYTLREEQTLVELWNRHNYEACVELLTEMINSLNKFKEYFETFDLQKKVKRFEALLKVAELYTAWDHFEYYKANGLKKHFTEYSKFHTTTDYDCLELLSKAKNKQTFDKLFKDRSNASFVISWAADRINNGDRFLNRIGRNISNDFNPSNNELACFRYFAAIEILVKRINRDCGIESSGKTLRPTLKAFKGHYENNTDPDVFNLEEYGDIFEFLVLRDNLAHAFFDFRSAEKNVEKVRRFALGLLTYFSERSSPETDGNTILQSHQFAQLDIEELQLMKPTEKSFR